jgi:hypothetical protein
MLRMTQFGAYQNQNSLSLRENRSLRGQNHNPEVLCGFVQAI